MRDCYSAKIAIQCALACVSDENLEGLSHAAQEAAMIRTMDRLALELRKTWAERAKAYFTRES